MILFGVKNDKWVIASMGHYDFIKKDELMCDGGQPGCTDYAGYTRSFGMRCVFEVPQTFAELYTDYQTGKSRKNSGIWAIENVKILPKEEWPDIESDQWKEDNLVWGTRGKNGDEPLKYIHLRDATTDHLEALLDYCAPLDVHRLAEKILKERKNDQ